MNLSVLMLMGLFLGVSWLVRITISERFSERVRQRTEGNSCETF
jgi:hypothetical protein